MYRKVFSRDPTPGEVQLGLEFLSENQRIVSTEATEPQEATPASAWQYGFGALNPTTGYIENFVAFDYFAPLLQVAVGASGAVLPAWKHASLLPANDPGNAHLTAKGGAPGDDLEHAVIRRWVSPSKRKISIDGTLSHQMGPHGVRFDSSNGIRGWIVSSRVGTLANWTVRGLTVGTSLSGLSVEKGEIIDFVVDSHDDDESDGFRWAPVIEEVLESETTSPDKKPRRWSAEDDFQSPKVNPLDFWEQYAQVLLETNEFIFVD